MGTDLHLYVEKYDKERGRWNIASGPNPLIKQKLGWAKHFREKGDAESIEQAEKYEIEAARIASGEALKDIESKFDFEWYAPRTFEGWLYDGRNYDLFAILADVRNGHGFAGVITGEGFNPICSPRGLPKDVSYDVEMSINDECYHSLSYIYLKELLEYNWDQVTTKQGMVSMNTYAEWKKEGGPPKSYSGGVSGPKVLIVSNERMDSFLSGVNDKQDGISYYTQVSWTESYKEAAGSFYTDSIEELEKISDSTTGMDVRIVFGFDS